MDVSIEKKVTTTLVGYTNNSLCNAPEEMNGVARTSSTFIIFNINPDSAHLNRHDDEISHKAIMQLLYLRQRTRSLLRTAVSFLYKRSTKAGINDWKRLTRLIHYLNLTIELKLRLRNDHVEIIGWWTDVSYGVHQDMEVLTGCTMSIGHGSVLSSSGAQE
jgi:hypothetical protein